MRCNYDACLPQGGSNELQAALQAARHGRQADSGCSLESPLQRCNVVNKQKSMLTTPCNNYNKSNCNNNEINKLQLGRATSQPVRQSTNQGIQSAAPGTPDGHTDRHTALVRLSALQEAGVGGGEGRGKGMHCSWRRRPIDSSRRIIRGPPCNGNQLNCVGWQQQQQQQMQLQLPRQPKGSCSRGQYSASCSFNSNSNSNCSSSSGWVTCPAMAMNCSKWRCLSSQEISTVCSNCHF